MIRDLLQGKPFSHPLHPLLIHFPISLFLLSFAFDMAALTRWGPRVAAEAALCSIVVAVVMALPAALTGLADYLGIRRDDRAKRIATWHMVLNLAVVALYAASAWLRWQVGVDRSPSGWALALSTGGLVLLGISGYLGGKLVYELGEAVGRHRRKTPAPKRTIRAPVEADGYATVGPAADLHEHDTLRVDADGTVLVVARVNGEICAFQEYCTHRYGPLSEGSISNGQVMCPWHRSCFDTKSGKVTQGPAQVDLRTFPVHVNEAGQVRVKAGQA